MTIVLSKDRVTVFDVPEVENLVASFDYNYFTEDELTNDSESAQFNKKYKSIAPDVNTVDYANKRLARTVLIAWSAIAGSGRADPELDKHSDSIVYEDDVCGGNFTHVGFRDPEFDIKVRSVISGSIPSVQTENKTSRRDISKDLSTRSGVDHTFITDYLSDRRTNSNISFQDTPRELDRGKSSGPASHGVLARPEDAPELTFIVKKEHASAISAAIMLDPNKLREQTQSITSKYELNTNQSRADVAPVHLSEPAYGLKRTSSDSSSESQVVGYILSKYEKVGAEYKEIFSRVINGSRISTYLDTGIKYGVTYTYSVRAVAKATVAVTVDGIEKSAKLFVSSRPVYTDVLTTEDVPPPPPGDLQFIWDPDAGGLVLIWDYPYNPQRDISRFQVFRRSGINEPFTLMQEYDHGPSYSTNPEGTDSKFVKKVSSPVTMWIDTEFKGPQLSKDGQYEPSSVYTYAVASIDVHGITSGYSVQHEIEIDSMTRKVIKRYVSRSGAPKAYPNFFVNRDAFIDSVKMKRKGSFNLYLCPKVSKVTDAQGNDLKAWSTENSGTSYVLSFVNTDVQKSADVKITLKDVTQPIFNSSQETILS
jgi:hypothetical protein